MSIAAPAQAAPGIAPGIPPGAAPGVAPGAGHRAGPAAAPAGTAAGPGFAPHPAAAAVRPAYGPYPAAPLSSRLRVDGLSENERYLAVGMHLSPFVSLIGIGPIALLIPLVIWLISKPDSAFNDDHGREIINAIISFFLLHVILLITVVGVMLWPVLWIVAFVSLIRGAIAAGRGEYFRYPVTIRFLR